MKAHWRKRYAGPGYPVDPNSTKNFNVDQGFGVCFLPMPVISLSSETWVAFERSINKMLFDRDFNYYFLKK